LKIGETGRLNSVTMKRISSLGLISLAAICALKHASPAAEPGETTGEKLLTEFWVKVYNQPQDFSTIDRLCTEDFVLTTSGKDVVGRAAFKEWVVSFSSKIRDLRLKNLEMFSSADGTRVVSRWVVTGFNRGMFGTSPDDRPVEFTGIAIWEVRDGKLAHNWVERSAYELMLGLKEPKK
jgi:predicted ester cyclase